MPKYGERAEWKAFRQTTLFPRRFRGASVLLGESVYTVALGVSGAPAATPAQGEKVQRNKNKGSGPTDGKENPAKRYEGSSV